MGRSSYTSTLPTPTSTSCLPGLDNETDVCPVQTLKTQGNQTQWYVKPMLSRAPSTLGSKRKIRINMANKGTWKYASIDLSYQPTLPSPPQKKNQKKRVYKLQSLKAAFFEVTNAGFPGFSTRQCWTHGCRSFGPRVVFCDVGTATKRLMDIDLSVPFCRGNCPAGVLFV